MYSPFELLPAPEKFSNYSKDELVRINGFLESQIERLAKENLELKKQLNPNDNYQLSLLSLEELEALRKEKFGASSEKLGSQISSESAEKTEEKKRTPPGPRKQKPSERYPNVPVVSKIIEVASPAPCSCCGGEMSDSGMTEESEVLTVIPKKYEIHRISRKKYRCKSCHGPIVTAPNPPRILEGSSYSDEMILDVALSKYCDLIPIERYAAMARRGSGIDLPPQSLIGLTHGLAHYVFGAYLSVRDEVLNARVGFADETPHRMLEGSKKSSWYLWGFSSLKGHYFECHDTRSGDVAIEVFKKSTIEFLSSDVYSGYGKSVREVNKYRLEQGLPLIKHVFCNAHSRRNFIKAHERLYREAEFYLTQYKEIYFLESQARGKPPSEVLSLRLKAKEHFEAMREQALKDVFKSSEKSQLSQALGYFLENYEGLTIYLTDAELPIDNNMQERAMRNPVIGRKTWYGTHSEQGATTAAILFTLIESCKLLKINPRDYFKDLIHSLHTTRESITPYQYLQLKSQSN